MKRWIRAALAMSVLLAYATAADASGRSYYVDVVTGNDQTGDGTGTLPLRTITKASKLVQAGDTVLIKGGPVPYDEGILPLRGGSGVSAPIRYVGYGSEPPRLVNLGTGTQPRDCIGIFYQNYVIVENIVCDGGATSTTGFRQFVNLWGASYNQILDAEYRGEIRSSADTMIIVAGDYTPTQRTSTYNQIKRCRLLPASAPTHGAVIHRQSSHNLFESNSFVLPARHLAFQIQSSYNVIRNNDFSNPLTSTISIEQPQVAPSDPVERNVIEGNRFFGTGGSVLSNTIQLMSNRTIVRSNLFFENSISAIAIGRGPNPLESKYLDRNRIYHNVFYRNVSTVPLPDATAPFPFRINISCPAADYGATQDNALVNNVFSRNNSTDGIQIFLLMGFSSAPPGGDCSAAASPPRIFGVNGTVVQNNALQTETGAGPGQKLFWVDHPQGGAYRRATIAEAESRYAPYIAANLEAAPEFVAPDAPTRDFHLQPASPLIDRGRMLSSVTQLVGTAGTSFVLQDATYFSAGNGIVSGDTIQFAGSAVRSMITAIDHATNRIDVTPAQIGARVGTGVSLPWNGSAPDIGAFETVPTGLGIPGQPTVNGVP